MDRKTLYSLVLLAGTSLAFPTMASAQASPAQQRSSMVAVQPGPIAQAVQRWEMLEANDDLGFSEYANFLTTYPMFPRAGLLQARAENALDSDPASPQSLVAFFDRNPPVTNAGKARYALALTTLNRPEAFDVARDAWRGGTMSDPSEAYMLGLFGNRFTAEDHDARIDALLWQGAAEAAVRQMPRISASTRDMAMARLALVQGSAPSSAGLRVPDGALADPGYVYNLTRYYRSSGQMPHAVSMLATRAPFTSAPREPEPFLTDILRVARGADTRRAVQIATRAKDLFPAGTDISKESFRIRDDWTSLMWLGGTKALYDLRDGAAAAPLFYSYGAAAQTPQTRSKGFYWAGYAAQQAGDIGEASRYYEMAAEYPEYYYGQLGLRQLGREVGEFARPPQLDITREQREAFAADPLVRAIASFPSRNFRWQTERRFFNALADRAETPADIQLAAELAQQLGMEELSVVVGRAASEKGIDGFVRTAFPVVDLPQGSNFSIVHAIARQESEFDLNRISHAGARGLMQLMPGTAREEAGKAGIQYMSASLLTDDQYNLRLGSNHIQRLLARYDGSYPLAFAAYNAGPGNVNKWLRNNGDPRTGAISWERWIEEIPFFETKNYVQRVIENAAVYEQLYPERTPYGRARSAGDFLR